MSIESVPQWTPSSNVASSLSSSARHSVTAVSPNVEGMTAISAWMIVCILFVFAALAGYAYLVRRTVETVFNLNMKHHKWPGLPWTQYSKMKWRVHFKLKQAQIQSNKSSSPFIVKLHL